MRKSYYLTETKVAFWEALLWNNVRTLLACFDSQNIKNSCKYTKNISGLFIVADTTILEDTRANKVFF
jgi:hypothetical protein